MRRRRRHTLAALRRPGRAPFPPGPAGRGYELDTDRGRVLSRDVVIATGGLSIPKIGATDFGYRVARQFGLTHRRAAPGPGAADLRRRGLGALRALAGLALPVQIETGEKKERMAFLEDLLFTHRGLCGPAVLQISSYWQPGPADPHQPGAGATCWPPAAGQGCVAQADRQRTGRLLPAAWPRAGWRAGPDWQRPVNEAADKALAALAERLARWDLVPTGTEGYAKAEVTAGGVDTRELSSQTLEAQTARACTSSARWWT